MNTPTLEQQRAERISGDRMLGLMSLNHAKRHFADLLMVARTPEEADKARLTLAHLEVLMEAWR